MRSFAPILALVASSSCDYCGLPCQGDAPPSYAWLQLPDCLEGDAIQRVEVAEPCRAELAASGDSVSVYCTRDGEFPVSLTLRSGRSFELLASYRSWNCPGLTVQRSGGFRNAGVLTCPDAGLCSGQSGCFLPGHGNCSLRCDVVGASCAVPSLGPETSACDVACACVNGSSSSVDGCLDDLDCALAPGDCCGCERGGRSVAILSSLVSELRFDCNNEKVPPPVCPEGNRCPAGARAICVQGRCLPTSGGTDAGP